MLDANLDGHPVDEVAASLARKNIPFVFVSGYGRDSLPASFGDAELLPKPFNTKQLLDVVGKFVTQKCTQNNKSHAGDPGNAATGSRSHRL